jgi:uncharacterized protein with beta-barrel porin domain
MREAPRASGPRLLLATSSVAALLAGDGARAVLAGSCTINPATNQSSVGNSAAINCINISAITVTGNVTNAGTGVITAGASGTGIAINNSRIGGTISNAGTIDAGNVGIQLGGPSTFTGGIANSGTISAGVSGIAVSGPSSFAGGISNSGRISAGSSGIFVNAVSNFAGGITNSGTISGPGNGIYVYAVSTFAGGISNSGAILNAQFGGIYINSVSTFAGGIANTGTMSAAYAPIALTFISNFSGGISNAGVLSGANDGIFVFFVKTFAGGISNSGTISGTGNGIWVGHVSTFSGGISNSGRISATRFTAAGIWVGNVSAFAGGITNTGTISAADNGIWVGGVSTLLGGIVNSGSISGPTGIAVSGSGPVSIFDSGTIIGTAGTAVNLSGNAAGNTFTLGPGYRVTGNVLGAGSDTLQLGGSGAGSFNLGAIGAGRQYQGFTSFNVVGGSWTATGTFAQSQAWNVDGGTLAGTGTLQSVNVNSGGALQPGIPGTAGTAMTIKGNLAFAPGAVYRVQLNPATASLANVGGTAMLTGGMVETQLAASYLSKQYTILTATGGLGGTTFAGLTNTNLPAGASDSLSYDARHVYLNLSPGFATYTGLGGNGQAVANTLTSTFNTSGGIAAALFGVSRTGLAQLDGETATGAERTALEMTTQFLGLMLDPFVDGRLGNAAGGSRAIGFAADEHQFLPSDVALAYASILDKAAPAPFAQRWTAWGASYGGGNFAGGSPTAGSSNSSSHILGFAGGMDYHVSPDTILGFALGGAGLDWGLSGGLGGGRSDSFQSGAYGMTRFGPAYFGGSLSFAEYWMTTSRAALGDQLNASFNAQSYGARLEGGTRFAVVPAIGAPFGVTPYAAVQAQAFDTPGFGETDVAGGGLGLSFAARNSTDVRTELGSRLDDPLLVARMPLMLRARLAWAHDFVGNPALGAAFETLPGSSFIVNGAPIPHDSALTSAGAELFITPRLTMLVKFDGDLAPSSQTYGGSGTLRYAW